MLKEILKNTISTVIATGILSILAIERFRTYFSVLIAQSYLTWIITLSVLLGIAVSFLLYGTEAWRIARKLLNYKSTPFKKTIFERIKLSILCIIAFMPLLISIIYFMYNYSWQYSFNRFKDNEVGILISDYREVSLKNYIPQEKYSILLEERLQEIKYKCKPIIPIKYFRTNAYFSSVKEAVEYCNKINASIVVWGEVSKSEGAINIRSRLNYATNYTFNVGSKSQNWINKLNSIYFAGDNFELRSLSGTPIDVDTLLMRIEDFLIWPSIMKSDELKLSGDSTYNYIYCFSLRKSILPASLKGFIIFKMAMYLSAKNSYQEAIKAWHGAFLLFTIDDNISKNKNKVLASISYSMAYCFKNLSNGDSAQYYENLGNILNATD